MHENLFDNLNVNWIFSNIEEIFKANINLWLQYLIEPLNEIRQNGDAFTPVTFKCAITHIPDLLNVYKQYYVNLPRCRSYTQEAVKRCINFFTFLEWANQQGHDHREPLWDQLTKPTTRLTQYRLLMESIRRNCSNSMEEQEVNEMFKSISEFLETINQQMTETKTWESLEIFASKLLCHDMIDNNIDDYSQLINDYTRFKLSILSPIKLPFPIILFNDQTNHTTNINQTLNSPSCTKKKSLAFLNNRRFSASALSISNNNTNSLFNNNNSPNRFHQHTISCNRSDSGIGDCNSSSAVFTDNNNISSNNTASIYLKQPTRTSSSRLNSFNEKSQSFPVLLSPMCTEDRLYRRSLMLDTLEQLDNWSDIYCRRTVQRVVLYSGNLRFKEPPNRSIETVCHILTDLFLITKLHKKDGNDCWKLLKNPIRLDKLIIQRGREIGVFGCAILDDFHNIASFYIFSAGPKCDEWIAQIESAKEKYRKLMEPEILIAQPLIRNQRDELCTNVMSSDLVCNSDNTLELRHEPFECNVDLFVESSPVPPINPIHSNIGENKRNVFFSSQTSLFENSNASHNNTNNNHSHSHIDDSMCIKDKRVRSNNSPIIRTNHERSSSRSYNYTSTESNSVTDQNIHPHGEHHHSQHSSLNQFDSRKMNHSHPIDKSKSISVSSLKKKDVDRTLYVTTNPRRQQQRYQVRELPTASESSLNKLRSSRKPVNIVSVSRSPAFRSSSASESRISQNPANRQDYFQRSMLFNSTKSSSSPSSSSSSTTTTSSRTEVAGHVNCPSIVIYRIQGDLNQNVNNTDNTNNRPSRSTNLQRNSVHQSLLSIDISDSGEQ
ncbi:unnamed protein product [Schistosoma turkestanicum]|nr:unnamed protein product [Schistosoma turkestanicum]